MSKQWKAIPTNKQAMKSRSCFLGTSFWYPNTSTTCYHRGALRRMRCNIINLRRHEGAAHPQPEGGGGRCQEELAQVGGRVRRTLGHISCRLLTLFCTAFRTPFEALSPTFSQTLCPTLFKGTPSQTLFPTHFLQEHFFIIFWMSENM